jgi:GNAT superfamily N-acetyltransferase
MSSITIPVKTNEHPYVRALNVLRDLSTVADLIELCFSNTMDNDGQRYLSDMRRASRDDGFLHWANRMAESTSLPLTGYVWEQDGRIIGNASLIPFRDKGKRIYLIANVAVHPDYRRRGIAQTLTQRAMKHARDKKTTAIWLHVRDDNFGAIALYTNLGFKEMARRTNWQVNSGSFVLKPHTDIQIIPRHARFWSLQQDWLRRLYPDVLNWYHSWNFTALRPGIMNWLYLLFVDYSIKQWAAVSGDDLLATLSWMPQGSRSESLLAATGEGSDPEALTQLLIHARRTLSNARLSLDFPAGEMTEAIAEAGFKPRRTLIWMRA